MLWLAASTLANAADKRDAQTGGLQLENQFLSVVFESSKAGPRLATITHRATGERWWFTNADELGLVVMSPAEIHDPKAQPRYRFQDEFRFVGATVEADGAGAHLDFTDGRLKGPLRTPD